MRLSKEQLNNLKINNNTDTIWSFSRFDLYRISKFSFFLRYIKNEIGQAEVSPYGCLGSACHDILDNLIEGKIQYEDMADIFDTEYSTNIKMLDLKFNRSDEKMNENIGKKYYEDLIHFFKNYKPLPYKTAIEKPVVIKVADGTIFVGYIDAIHKDKDGNYVITDFKTSSLYRGKAVDQHAGQLVLYAAGINQAGIPEDKIKIQWNFLRYVKAKYQQVKGDWKDTIIERREIGEKLQAKAKTWLKKFGYEPAEYLEQMLLDNSIECLPDEIKEKFVIEDCYVEVENWFELWYILRQEIINTVNEIEQKVQEYNKNKDETVWYDTDEKLEQESYFLSQLSEYSINQLHDYKNYIERKEAEKEAAEDLLGVNKKDDDLDWLNDI